MKVHLRFIYLIFLLGCNSGETVNNQIRISDLRDLTVPTQNNSSLPFLFTSNDKDLIMSWVENVGDSTILKYSKLSNGTWGNPTVIASGRDWFVNWADYPSLMSDGKNMIAHFLAKSSNGTYSYDVHILQSKNNGLSWSGDFIPHNDNTQTEHGFVTILPWQDGFITSWLDGRNTGGHDDHTSDAAMTLRSAFINADGAVSEQIELDNKTCDCCQTTGAITENGPVFIYRDRSDEEVRDISIVRRIDGKWTEPKTVYKDNWKIAGCPVNGPRAAAHGNTLAIAWFSVSNEKSEVKVIFSQDSGETFGQPIKVDDGTPIGRVDVSLVNNDSAIVSWMEKTDSGAEIRFRIVEHNQTLAPSLTVSEIDPSRQSGFPQMEVVDQNVYFTWTQIVNDSTYTIKSRWIAMLE